MIIAARKFSTETIGVFSENLSFLSHNAELANEKTNKQTSILYFTLIYYVHQVKNIVSALRRSKDNLYGPDQLKIIWQTKIIILIS